MINLEEHKGTDLRMQRLLEMITGLQEESCLEELKLMLEKGVDPEELQDCFMEGMRNIGILFENGTYFIAALIMAGEIMRSAMEILSPYLVIQQKGRIGGKVLLGTVQGDIHDLGKNLFSLLLKCHGFKVTDIGVDIAPELFLEKIREIEPDIVGISCVLTNGLVNLKKTVTLLDEILSDSRPPVVIGGTCLDEHFAKIVNSAIWAKDASVGLKICQKVMEEKSAG